MTRCSPVLSMLEGFEAPAKSWETEILSARLKGYQPSWLDAECHAGRIAWSRLTPPPAGERDPVQGARSGDADRPARPAADPRLDVACARLRRGAAEPARAGRARLPRRPRRPVLRRDRRIGPSPAGGGRRRARRTRRARARDLGQLRRIARPADAVGTAEAARRREAARPRPAVPYRERRPLGAGPPPAAGGRRRSVPRRRGGARGARPSSPLRRRVLAAAGARGDLAAAVARPFARLPAARKPGRDPRRPVRRRILGRAIRPAGSRRPPARDPPPAGFGPMGVAVRRRSAQSRRRAHAGRPPAGADRQPRRLPRRAPGRRAFRRAPCRFSATSKARMRGRRRSGSSGRRRRGCWPG